MIVLKNVFKKYDEFELGPINYQFIPGNSYCIMGKSGTGKSTLINIIGMLEKQDTGDLVINNILNPNIASSNGRKILKNDLSYMFQNYGLVDNETVKENLLLVNNRQGDINNVLDKVGLKGKENYKVASLSGGEQQRVAIAKILIKDSKIIICDEPTGNLDDETGDIIISQLLNLVNSEKILIVVTHDKRYRKLFEHIIDL